MRIEPEKNGVSIVFVGSLNPTIFHPAWFLANNLLKKEDIENAAVEIIHSGIAAFSIGNWVKIRVEPNRFIAETTEPPFVRISDLVVRIFGEALTHTPIFQMGINRKVHFSVGDEEIRNKIGKMLAPQDAWGAWAKSIEGSKKEKRGGMISLTMRQADLDDREKGHIHAKVEPSFIIKDGAGILVDVNDHYEISPDTPGGAGLMADILAKYFDKSIGRSEWIIDQIMSLKEKV